MFPQRVGCDGGAFIDGFRVLVEVDEDDETAT
jgi:hypothetical protein